MIKQFEIKNLVIFNKIKNKRLRKLFITNHDKQ